MTVDRTLAPGLAASCIGLFLALLASPEFCHPAVAADFAQGLSGRCSTQLVQTGIAVDASGNQYLSGYFYGGAVTIGNVTLTGVGLQDAYVAKLDAAGNAIWLRGFGGAGAMAYGQGVAIDSGGNVYLGGYFNGADLTTPALAIKGDEDGFLVKLDNAGNPIWAANYGGSGTWMEGQGVSADAAGNAFLAGQFRGAGPTVPPFPTPSPGGSDAFVIKANAGGGTVWAQRFGGNAAQMTGQAVTVDLTGNAYLTGNFIGATPTVPPLTMPPHSTYALKLDSGGNMIWANGFGGGAAVSSSAIAVDGTGSVYLSGNFTGATSLRQS